MSARRLRAHGLILAACLWSVYIWNMATPGAFDRAGNFKGTDFLHFYTLGSLALAHRGADLYSMEAQSQLAAQLVPSASGIRYLPLYPPQVSLFFGPFALLPYSVALTLWLTLSALLYSICCYTLWRASPNLRHCGFTVVILALGYPAFWHLIAWGQTSALALLFLTLTFFALRAQRDFLAGLALGCLIFKPQLGVAAAIIFIFAIRWKLVAGAILSASAQLASAWLYYGAAPLREWGHALFNVPQTLPLLEPRIYQTHSLRTFWTMLIPSLPAGLALYLVSAFAVIALTIACWRSRLPLSIRFSGLLFATVLLAPHLTVYDLVILVPAFLLLTDWIATQSESTATGELKVLLYFSYALPLLGFSARWTHFQFSVPVMAALIFVLWQVKNQATPAQQELLFKQKP